MRREADSALHCAANAPRLMVTWLCAAAAAQLRCTWSPGLMTAQPLRTFSMATFPSRSFGETMISVTKAPAPPLYSASTSSLFLSLAVSSTSSSLSRCGEQHNCQLCMGYWEDRLVEPFLRWHPVPHTASSGCCRERKVVFISHSDMTENNSTMTSVCTVTT